MLLLLLLWLRVVRAGCLGPVRAGARVRVSIALCLKFLGCSNSQQGQVVAFLWVKMCK